MILTKNYLIENYLIKRDSRLLLEYYNLEQRFDYFNSLFFNNDLDKIPVSFGKVSSNVAGLYRIIQKEIIISNEYKQENELMIDSILIHEMVHAYCQKFDLIVGNKYHGKEFKEIVDRINSESNDIYHVGYTDISIAWNSEIDEEETLYFIIGLYNTSLGVSSLSAPIQVVSEFSKSAFQPFVDYLKKKGDVKLIQIYEVNVNNTFLTKDYIENNLGIDKINNGCYGFKSKSDDYTIKMMKQSKQYKLLAYYNYREETFLKV